MLVIDNVPVTSLRLNAAGGVADGSVDATLHDAGIHNNSVLTAVAKQPVSLMCHHDWRDIMSYTGMVSFESGEPLGDPWQTSNEFSLCFADLCSFHNPYWRQERSSHDPMPKDIS